MATTAELLGYEEDENAPTSVALDEMSRRAWALSRGDPSAFARFHAHLRAHGRVWHDDKTDKPTTYFHAWALGRADRARELARARAKCVPHQAAASLRGGVKTWAACDTFMGPYVTSTPPLGEFRPVAAAWSGDARGRRADGESESESTAPPLVRPAAERRHHQTTLDPWGQRAGK
jgi:hypothetical protein